MKQRPVKLSNKNGNGNNGARTVQDILNSFTEDERAALFSHVANELKLGRSTQSRKIACLSDIHNGGITAVCSSEPVIGDSGTTHKPNVIQRAFLEHWLDVRDWLGKTNILVLNGEPFNGPNFKSNGAENWSSNINDQYIDTFKLLAPFRNKLFIMTRGSGYHSKRDNTNYDERLAERLNVLPYKAYNLPNELRVKRGQRRLNIKDGDASSRTDYYANFIVNGINLNFTHHVGYSRRYYYRATALSAEMAQMEHDRGYYFPNNEDIHVLGRGHVHYNVYLEFPSTKGFTTPAWKMPDEYLFRHGLGGVRPHVGACSLVIEQNGKVEYDKLILKKKFPKPYAPNLTELSQWTERDLKELEEKELEIECKVL